MLSCKWCRSERTHEAFNSFTHNQIWSRFLVALNWCALIFFLIFYSLQSRTVQKGKCRNWCFLDALFFSYSPFWWITVVRWVSFYSQFNSGSRIIPRNHSRSFYFEYGLIVVFAVYRLRTDASKTSLNVNGYKQTNEKNMMIHSTINQA